MQHAKHNGWDIAAQNISGSIRALARHVNDGKWECTAELLEAINILTAAVARTKKPKRVTKRTKAKAMPNNGSSCVVVSLFG